MMGKLLRKEIHLCLNPQVIIFVFLSVFIGIPSWPSMVAFFYPMSGLATIFPRALADQDISYTAMLPIRKRDVVRGKVLLVSFIELLSLVVAAPVAIIKNYLITPHLLTGSETPEDLAYLAQTAPSFATFGFVLIAYAIYNLVFFPWYYKNPQKINWPQIFSVIIGVVCLGLFAGFQALWAPLYSYDSFGIMIQLIVLGLGIVLFVLGDILAEAWAGKRFEKVDL